jgi:hypothetical protein
MSAEASQLPEVPSSLDRTTIPVISLLDIPPSLLGQIKISLSTPDPNWNERPSLSTPSLSFIDWTRDSPGTNSDVYRIAAKAAESGHSALIFLDGKSVKDESVVICRLLEHGELSVFRVRASRAALGLKHCVEGGLPCSEAPRFKHDMPQIGSYYDPLGQPFSDRIIRNEIRHNGIDFTSVPKAIETKLDRPIVVSLTPEAIMDDLFQGIPKDEKLSESDIAFYSFTGPSNGSRAEHHRAFYQILYSHPWSDNEWKKRSPVCPKLFFVKDPSKPEALRLGSSSSLIYAHELWQDSRVLQLTQLRPKDLMRAWNKSLGIYKTPLHFDTDRVRRSESWTQTASCIDQTYRLGFLMSYRTRVRRLCSSS